MKTPTKEPSKEVPAKQPEPKPADKPTWKPSDVEANDEAGHEPGMTHYPNVPKRPTEPTKPEVDMIRDGDVMPRKGQTVVARQKGRLFLAQYRVDPNAPKGGFYGEHAGAFTDFIGAVDAWVAVPDF